MPKSRPRPVSHFRGVMTSSTTTSTSTTSVVRQRQDGASPIQASPETTSMVKNVRMGPAGAVGGGMMEAGGPGRGMNTEVAGPDQQHERAMAADNAGGNSPKEQQRIVEEARQRGRTTGTNEQLMRMGRCSQLFEENYCLNGGKCHNFTIANSTMPTCECADGFMGERCESKYLDGTYLSMRKPKIHIETASMYYGASLALMVLLVVFYYLSLSKHFSCHKTRQHQQLQQQLQEQQEPLVPLVPPPVHQVSRGSACRVIRTARV